MKKEFVPYELALRMKQLGFDEPCFGYYKAEYEDGINPLPVNLILEQNKASSNVFYKTSAPTWQQAFRWFREEYDLRIWIESNHGVSKFEYVIATTNHNFIDKQFNDFSSYKTYEEAELACLEKLIEIVEQK
jgi:hypothetical protein